MTVAQLTVDAVFRQFGIPATFTPAGGVGRPVRVIARRPDTTLRFGDTVIQAESATFELRVSEVAAVAKGDLLTVAGSDLLIQSAKRLDPDRLVWTLEACAVETGDQPVPPPTIDADTLDGLDSTAFERRSRFELPFAWGDASPRLVVRTLPGQTVSGVDLTILVPFDGTGSRLAVGTVDQPEALLGFEDCLPSEAATYSVAPNRSFPVSTDLLLTIVPGAQASQGSGVVIVTLT